MHTSVRGKAGGQERVLLREAANEQTRNLFGWTCDVQSTRLEVSPPQITECHSLAGCRCSGKHWRSNTQIPQRQQGGGGAGKRERKVDL